MNRYGMKLGSNDIKHIPKAEELLAAKQCDYVELFVVPGSFKATIDCWKKLDCTYVIHAPHYAQGMNLADKHCFAANMKMVAEVVRFANDLAAHLIIFHPGIDGDTAEVARQLCVINDPRIVVENKPYSTIFNDGRVCVGNSPEQIADIMRVSKVGFCCDVGHAFCSANSRCVDPVGFLMRFVSLRPSIFHLSDGNINSPIDSHLNIGQGTYDFKNIMHLVPDNSMITLETPKRDSDPLSECVDEIIYLNSISVQLGS